MKNIYKLLILALASTSILSVSGCYCKCNKPARTLVTKVEHVEHMPAHHHVIEKIRTEHVHK